MAAIFNHLHCLAVGQARLPTEFTRRASAQVTTTTAAGAAEASGILRKAAPDLIVTDDLRGRFQLDAIAAWAVVSPVVLMSGEATLAQRLAALEAGVEDFIALPASTLEIALRIERALIRWGRKRGEAENLIRFNDFALDPGARVLRRNGCGEVALSASEESLLELLLTQPDRRASRQEITRRCLKTAFHERSRAADMLASKLRAKLRELGEEHALETLRGEGYRLRLDQPRA